MTNLETIISILGAVGVLAAGWVIIRSTTSRTNTSAGAELVGKLEKLRIADKEEFENRFTAVDAGRKRCEDQHQESLSLIHNLQGQVDVLKTIPLRDISSGIESILTSMNKVVGTLALNTEKVARAAEEVKVTLSEGK